MTALEHDLGHSKESRLSAQRVLIAYPDREIAKLTARPLINAGHSTVCACSESEIVEQLANQKFDLVVLAWAFVSADNSKRLVEEVLKPAAVETIYGSIEPRLAMSVERQEVLNLFTNQSIVDGVELRSLRLRFNAYSSPDLSEISLQDEQIDLDRMMLE